MMTNLEKARKESIFTCIVVDKNGKITNQGENSNITDNRINGNEYWEMEMLDTLGASIEFPEQEEAIKLRHYQASRLASHTRAHQSGLTTNRLRYSSSFLLKDIEFIMSGAKGMTILEANISH
jgi:hypothetical protein